MKPINVDDLRDKIIFLGVKGHSATKKPGKWRHLSKCVCFGRFFTLKTSKNN